MITGTRVVNNQGLEPTSREIAIRTISRFIPFEPFSFFGGTGLHDSYSRTVVITKNSPFTLVEETKPE